jgi:hypothetical protein
MMLAMTTPSRSCDSSFCVSSFEPMHRVMRDICASTRERSTHHVTLNLQASNRPPREILEELATDVLPEFQTADES